MTNETDPLNATDFRLRRDSAYNRAVLEYQAEKAFLGGGYPQAEADPMTEANQDMIDGYLDGLDLSNPEPSGNRSCSYRHGFANGRDDKRRKPRASAAELRQQADNAMAADRR